VLTEGSGRRPHPAPAPGHPLRNPPDAAVVVDAALVVDGFIYRPYSEPSSIANVIKCQVHLGGPRSGIWAVPITTDKEAD